MESFIIQGGRKLSGAIDIRGSKNAATPILAATTLISGVCVLDNVPRIADVETMLVILQSMGAQVTWTAAHTLSIDCTNIDPAKIDYKSIAKIRSSVFFMSCLARRFGHIRLSIPGGCNIGARPLDAHTQALRDLGYDVVSEENYLTLTRAREPLSEVVLWEISVTATENAILASVLGSSTVRIECAAAEPHVQDLCWFLQRAGAMIEGIGTHSLIITGVEKLLPLSYTIMPDPIEAGSLMVLAAATHSSIEIRGAAPSFLKLEMRKFKEIGMSFDMKQEKRDPGGHYDIMTIIPHKQQALNAIKILKVMPYPGFAADLIQPFALLMTQAQGISLLYDWMYEGRQRYVTELQKMGANITVLDPHRILIVGPTPLYGKEITSYDLRAGATLVLAGLIAEGTTTIHGIDQVDRGYEALDTRLKSLGANIERV